MQPIETDYRLAISGQDYRQCQQLFRQEGGATDTDPLSFPTVMARRDGEIVGFLATQRNDDYVIAGPLVVRGRRNPVVAMRLIEAYDSVMMMHGIKLYYFSTEADREDAFKRERLESLGMQFWEERDNVAWYKRKL